jgi:plasmid stabilization system protein ParE
MAILSPEADAQVQGLIRYYGQLGRIEAIARLIETLDRAAVKVDQLGARGRHYPSVYAELAIHGLFWTKVHCYWFAYTIAGSDTVITNVLHDHANIPRRMSPPRTP